MADGRERWGRRADFIFASIGSAIGLGNVWRFPYITYANGGGAFLIPYFVALLTAGIPLVILEFALGRTYQGGAPAAFSRIKKGLEWIGWLALFAVMLIFFYYSVIMAWSFDYIWHSIKLSWGTNAKDFFYHQFLQKSSGPGILGSLRWPIVIGLFITWLWSFQYLRHGTKGIGKEIYITVILPWLILIVMVIRGITLPGAINGLNYYLAPNFKALLSPSPWLAAYGQVFFSLSLGMGTLIIYSSYLPKKSDITNSAFIVSLADAGTAFFAGFAVFSGLGYLAFMKGVGVTHVVESGFGLAFITYPTVIKLMPFGAPVFGVLFFLLLATLAIDSQISQVEPFVAGFIDKWNFSRKKVLPIVVVIGFLVGLIFCTQGGYHWIDIVDFFTLTFGITFVGLMEAVIVGYVVKPKNLRNYINEVSEIHLGKWWDVCIMVITPIILGISFILGFIKVVRKGYGGYPVWVNYVGFGLLFLIFALSFIFMALKGRESR